ncbi:nuclear RNA export factor 1 [Adelges cooleyi]|uniref:nuclear RNA export factor 1 n=1 Tax=Adelges cooleyi TaxID=133065 RepID=UPI00217F6091|nr:nuclear RNA export factor 1 [Adelges cooleyi]
MADRWEGRRKYKRTNNTLHSFKANKHRNHVCKNLKNKFEKLDYQPNNKNGPFSNNDSQKSYKKVNTNNHKDKNNLSGSSWLLRKSFTGWYSIFVPDVQDGNGILRLIQTYVKPISFFPYKAVFRENSLEFLVDDYNVATALYYTNNKLLQSDNKKLVVKVGPYTPPKQAISSIPVSDVIKEKMMEAILLRYKSDTRSLNLSNFHNSQAFIVNQLFVTLNEPRFLIEALNMASKITNDLNTLSLENNNIYLTSGLIWIRRNFPDLKTLNLSGNQLNDINVLRELNGFSIEALDLSKNPVSNTDDKDYREEIQQLFPNLTKLDNVDLPARYSGITNVVLKMPFHLGNSYAVPENYNPEKPNPIAILVDSFISQYFERYDSSQSKQLIAEAYHENATFSMSSYPIYEKKSILKSYLAESRNLLKIAKMNAANQARPTDKSKFIHKGRGNIIQILEKLPKTKHDLASFVVDVPLAYTGMVQIVVNGAYVEEYEENKKLLVQSFCRCFCLMQLDDNSWSIVSDMLFVTTANTEQYFETCKSFNVPKDDHDRTEDKKAIFLLPLSSSSDYPPLLVAPCDNSPYTNDQLETIKLFAKESGMNETFSGRCLAVNNWNYMKASLSFSELKTRVPSIAFEH